MSGENLKARVAGLFDEAGCTVNRTKETAARKLGCSGSLIPGATAGGCAFDGAKIALQPITDVAHLVHGPLACEGNSWDNRHAASSGPDLYRRSFTTDLTQMDIVMGNGEKRLYRAIKEIIARHTPPAIFVYSTCVTALIGDDIEAVCRHATAKTGTLCVPVNSPGFVGKKNLGTRLAGEALMDYVIGTQEPEVSTSTDINLLGEYNLCGEAWQVKPLFEQLGIRLHTCITGDARYRDIASAHRVRLNMMVCSNALITLARRMQERWGIPYFEGSFYGITQTSATLRLVARMLVERGGPADLPACTEALVASEEKRARERLAPYRDVLVGKRVLLYTGGVKSWSVVSALQDLGMQVVATSVRKSSEEEKLRARELIGEEAEIVEKIPPREMYARLSGGGADILLSGGRTQFVALKAKVPWLDINQERHLPYAGYDGMVTLARELHRSLANPVWRAVRAPAPWDRAAGAEEAPQIRAAE
jgi:nitrogenase molybdenum-cofactor synthesis protein NifE